MRLLAVLDAGCSQVVVDVTAVSFCDSTGLAILLALRRQVRQAGGVLQVQGAHDQLAPLLRITGVDAVLNAPGTPQSVTTKTQSRSV